MFGCLLVALWLIAGYVRWTVLDTDRYVDTMAPIAESPDVQRAVADKLDAAITNRVDFGSLIRSALPDRADPLAPALATGPRQAISSRLDDFVASDRFQRLWEEANRRVHGRVAALLKSQGLVQAQNGVDLLQAVAIDQEVLPREAAADIFDTLIGLLRTAVRVLVVVAVVLALIALVIGRTGALTARLGRLRFDWVAEHRAVLQGVAVGLDALVLFSWDPPTAASS